MTPPDGRRPLEPRPDDPHPWTYLEPVLEAERGWGNPQRSIQQDKNGWLMIYMSRPLHIERIRDLFIFPDEVKVTDSGSDTAIVDPSRDLIIEGAQRPDQRRQDNSRGTGRGEWAARLLSRMRAPGRRAGDTS